MENGCVGQPSPDTTPWTLGPTPLLPQTTPRHSLFDIHDKDKNHPSVSLFTVTGYEYDYEAILRWKYFLIFGTRSLSAAVRCCRNVQHVSSWMVLVEEGVCTTRAPVYSGRWHSGHQLSPATPTEACTPQPWLVKFVCQTLGNSGISWNITYLRIQTRLLHTLVELLCSIHTEHRDVRVGMTDTVSSCLHVKNEKFSFLVQLLQYIHFKWSVKQTITKFSRSVMRCFITSAERLISNNVAGLMWKLQPALMPLLCHTGLDWALHGDLHSL